MAAPNPREYSLASFVSSICPETLRLVLHAETRTFRSDLLETAIDIAKATRPKDDTAKSFFSELFEHLLPFTLPSPTEILESEASMVEEAYTLITEAWECECSKSAGSDDSETGGGEEQIVDGTSAAKEKAVLAGGGDLVVGEKMNETGLGEDGKMLVATVSNETRNTETEPTNGDGENQLQENQSSSTYQEMDSDDEEDFVRQITAALHETGETQTSANQNIHELSLMDSEDKDNLARVINAPLKGADKYTELSSDERPTEPTAALKEGDHYTVTEPSSVEPLTEPTIVASPLAAPVPGVSSNSQHTNAALEHTESNNTPPSYELQAEPQVFAQKPSYLLAAAHTSSSCPDSPIESTSDLSMTEKRKMQELEEDCSTPAKRSRQMAMESRSTDTRDVNQNKSRSDLAVGKNKTRTHRKKEDFRTIRDKVVDV
ncbi:hypothetical protein BJ508DRAFT_347279 [Ascobolus immersus RN42]|uniref:Uncharacterized protein n=1 Tax=Ascobolus immersus RN42 TaxID=1160509 RepID=A0A3N4I4M6_ASCIM|nr:hypothetical protein BJ508DRAFT_347279 [Ascobolus immersus RN42]